MSEQAQKSEQHQLHKSTGIYFYYPFSKKNNRKKTGKKTDSHHKGKGVSVYPLLIESFLLGIFQ